MMTQDKAPIARCPEDGSALIEATLTELGAVFARPVCGKSWPHEEITKDPPTSNRAFSEKNSSSISRSKSGSRVKSAANAAFTSASVGGDPMTLALLPASGLYLNGVFAPNFILEHIANREQIRYA
jgi:hypothetical protein